MSDFNSIENHFLSRIKKIIEENISNEKFGVSELSSEIGMSRSNLLRKIKKTLNISVSQFIREVRLNHAMEMLKQTTLSVSEISYKVGFSSTSYFIKCFHDYYGYPPGEAVKRSLSKNVGKPMELFTIGNSEQLKPERDQINDQVKSLTKKFMTNVPRAWFNWAIIILAAIIAGFLAFTSDIFETNRSIALSEQTTIKKSIAVLPFINDSNDSTNVYLINGLMESILNNLQKIEDLRVISRTSVEKYRNNPKTITEIAKELNVDYFIEGSGQKIGNKILLNIQLIEAQSDKHLWSEQFNREIKDIFELQVDIAKNIADKIQVIITPEEKERINKIPTTNLVAYDYFLKGLDLFYTESPDNLIKAITYFEKAIEHDNKFARAYADISISYYLLDAYQSDKKYSVEINNYADKAILMDSQLPQCLIAKALSYIHNKEYDMALPYLENALEYNPNSALVINTLSDFYTTYSPNTEKYLEYALKGIGLDIAANDSITASYIYLHISNAFIQSGFVDEAEKYIYKSLDYNPENIYSEYVKAYILYAKNKNLEQIKNLLIETLKKDSTRLDVMQEVGKIHYYMRDYESAYNYYKRFIEIRKAYNLDIYRGEDAKIAVILSKIGRIEESEKMLLKFKNYAENDKSIYKSLSLSVYYSQMGDTKLALEQMKLFSEQENYHYWTILFLEIDPLIDNIKEMPEFKRLFHKIENKFWKSHKQIKITLEEEKLL